MVNMIKKIKAINPNQKGMTLVEIMIVLLILGGLASILATTVMGRLKKAKIGEAKLQISELGKSLDMFYADCAFYPSSDQGLSALVQAPSGEPSCSGWGPDPYIKRVPRDPWNNEYVYEAQGNSYVLKSLGGDKREGGTGEDEDISSENL
ncbi:MAG: type II secretion system major pseudopilin GspG [Bdellovibrionales bacterium]|nr:type II secretion system major pseudopilin GspG [Bdellovibrionales bacterium]